jgi:hypothetical protein
LERNGSLTISTKQLRELRRRAARLASEPALNFFELAGLIAALHDANPGTLRDLEESGMGRRRLYYLLEVGRFIDQQGIRKAEADRVGWTKLRIVARHLREADSSHDDVKACLELAVRTRAHSLAQVLRGRRVPRKRVVSFVLTTAEKAQLSEALLAYGAERWGRKGLKNKERALIKLVQAAMGWHLTTADLKSEE